MAITTYTVDETTKSIFLELPVGKIILFQALIDTYEGLGLVRTVRVNESVVSILTTNDMEASLKDLLVSIQPEYLWREVPRPAEGECV
jgi:hypothetical protein